MPNRLADTVFWTFGAAASLWFIICVVYRIGGETRADYFVAGLVGAGVLWGCGWLARTVLSGQPKPWLSTLYEPQSLAPDGRGDGRRERPRNKRSAKRIVNRPNMVGNAKRHRRRRAHVSGTD